MGLGRQGSRILELALQKGIEPVEVVDASPEAGGKAAAAHGKRIRVLEKNPLALSEAERIGFLKGYGLVLDALPSFHSYRLIRSGIRAGVKMVSVSFLAEDFMSLDGEARECGALIIPDCGGAPGFSHMMAGYSVQALGGAERVVMKVGAIPAEPRAPFFHSLTWSVEDLLEEYFRPAKCRHGGLPEAPDPFEGIAEERIQGLPLQSFLSDGARSFLVNFPGVPFMEERTLRHHGHLDFMRPFREAGLLSREPVATREGSIPPCRLLAALLEKRFSGLPPEDRFIMQVVVTGPGGRHRHEYNMPYLEKEGVFGLVNSVAVTAVESALMAIDGTVAGPGVLPLELLADKPGFDRMSKAHRDQGALVELYQE